MNCLYYDKLIVYIDNNFKILNIIDHSDKTYIDTEQNTCMFIIQKCDKKHQNNKYMLKVNGNVIFNSISNMKQIK